MNNNLNYTFKFYFKDGKEIILKGLGRAPEDLFNDFDGLMKQEDFEELQKANLTTKQILEMAFDVYKKIYKDKSYYRIEIINIHTGKVVDFIEQK